MLVTLIQFMSTDYGYRSVILILNGRSTVPAFWFPPGRGVPLNCGSHIPGKITLNFLAGDKLLLIRDAIHPADTSSSNQQPN